MCPLFLFSKDAGIMANIDNARLLASLLWFLLIILRRLGKRSHQHQPSAKPRLIQKETKATRTIAYCNSPVSSMVLSSVPPRSPAPSSTPSRALSVSQSPSYFPSSTPSRFPAPSSPKWRERATWQHHHLVPVFGSCDLRTRMKSIAS